MQCESCLACSHLHFGHLVLSTQKCEVAIFLCLITEVWHIAHFWVSYGRCTMPGSPIGRSEGLSRRWAG